jgi:hypothetical protein
MSGSIVGMRLHQKLPVRQTTVLLCHQVHHKDKRPGKSDHTGENDPLLTLLLTLYTNGQVSGVYL